MTAFLRSVYPSLGEESRYIHMGLTTSDVWDTATSLQMVDAADLLANDLDLLLDAVEARAREHKDSIMIGRTHGVHAEPVTLGLKLALWADEIRRNIERLKDARSAVAVGKISGAVGTYALVSPKIEERVCSSLGIRAAPVSNQVIQRDIHAQYVMTLGPDRRIPGEVCDGDKKPSTHGDSWSWRNPSAPARPVPRRCLTSATLRSASGSAGWPD